MEFIHECFASLDDGGRMKRTFDDLTGDQVNAFNEFILILRKLQVIGNLNTTVTRYSYPISSEDFYPDYKNNVFCIKYVGYSSDKSEMKLQLEIEKIFRRIGSFF